MELSRLLAENNIVVIGISGKIGSGKSTLCRNLLLAYGADHSVERNFADALKEQVSNHLGIPLSVFYSEEGKQYVRFLCFKKKMKRV